MGIWKPFYQFSSAIRISLIPKHNASFSYTVAAVMWNTIWFMTAAPCLACRLVAGLNRFWSACPRLPDGHIALNGMRAHRKIGRASCRQREWIVVDGVE